MSSDETSSRKRVRREPAERQLNGRIQLADPSMAAGMRGPKSSERAEGQSWKFGNFKSAAQWESQMAKRGWTPQQISEAIQKGEKVAAENLVNKGNGATRYVHPETGRSVVLDNVTKEVIHIGGDGFKY